MVVAVVVVTVRPTPSFRLILIFFLVAHSSVVCAVPVRTHSVGRCRPSVYLTGTVTSTIDDDVQCTRVQYVRPTSEKLRENIFSNGRRESNANSDNQKKLTEF